jgi:hypothetical protein
MTPEAKHLAFTAAFALAAALLAAPAAQAFTFERSAPGDHGAQLNYTDPMLNLAPKSDDGAGFNGNSNGTIYQQGGVTLQMHQGGGYQSFDQRYNPDYLFDPFKREGR